MLILPLFLLIRNGQSSVEQGRTKLCDPLLSVTSNQKSTGYEGTYTYTSDMNGAPVYSQNNGDGFIYRNSLVDNGNDNWHFNKHLGSKYADLWSPKRDCPSDVVDWFEWSGAEWVLIPGVTVAAIEGTY